MAQPSLSNYLRHGGYVFIGVSLFVSRITEKLFNRFSENSIEGWHIGHGRKQRVLVVMVTVRLRLRLGESSDTPRHLVCYPVFV